MNRKNVLLLFGGESSEHAVSVASARNVYAAIDDAKYNVLLGYIDRRGKWWLLDKFGSEVDTHGAPQVAPVLGTGSFVTFPGSRVVKPDVVLPILHGQNGEDGSVQGLAQLLHVPVVGCDMTASAICMDKIATKEILSAHGVAVVPYETLHQGADTPSFEVLNRRLGSPLFVKPARAGSSVGVSKVASQGDLDQALDLAYRHGSVALVEQAVVGRELEVAVLGNPPNHQVSGVGEVKPGDDFYNYEAKYDAASTALVIDAAELDDSLRSEIRRIAGDVYATLGCQGLARVDFFLAADGTVYVNEVNTIPGFTSISLYPRLWRREGVSYAQLIERLIGLALDKA